jgi:hypothetical protein
MPAAIPAPAPLLGEQLAGPLSVEAPQRTGALTVFPIVTDRSSALGYRAFADARGSGVVVQEARAGGSVGDVAVVNPLDAPVLLYEGEEIRGAQQNRTFDVSVLVGARSKAVVPVSCVEAGRWEHRRGGEAFTPAPQTAYPELRAHKSRRVRAAHHVGAALRANQGEVWENVRAKSDRLRVASPTAAMHDVYESRRDVLSRAAERIPARPGQVGMLVAIGGAFRVLDYVSDVTAFATLHGPLVQGYALDAVDPRVRSQGSGPSRDDARDVLALLLRAAPSARPGVGLGEQLAFEGAPLSGTGLACDGELVALSAYAS